MKHFTHDEKYPWPIGTVLRRINYPLNYTITVQDYIPCPKVCEDCMSNKVRMVGIINELFGGKRRESKCIKKKNNPVFWKVVH